MSFLCNDEITTIFNDFSTYSEAEHYLFNPLFEEHPIASLMKFIKKDFDAYDSFRKKFTRNINKYNKQLDTSHNSSLDCYQTNATDIMKKTYLFFNVSNSINLNNIKVTNDAVPFFIALINSNMNFKDNNWDKFRYELDYVYSHCIIDESDNPNSRGIHLRCQSRDKLFYLYEYWYSLLLAIEELSKLYSRVNDFLNRQKVNDDYRYLKYNLSFFLYFIFKIDYTFKSATILNRFAAEATEKFMPYDEGTTLNTEPIATINLFDEYKFKEQKLYFQFLLQQAKTKPFQ